MLCQAPELSISLARHQEEPERPDEFGFKLDDVQALMALNNTNFIYYPNPEFEPLTVSGVLELKPGSPIILKVWGQILPTFRVLFEFSKIRLSNLNDSGLIIAKNLQIQNILFNMCEAEKTINASYTNLISL